MQHESCSSSPSDMILFEDSPCSCPRQLDVIRPKDVPRGRVWHEKNYQQARASGSLHEVNVTRFLSKAHWEHGLESNWHTKVLLK